MKYALLVILLLVAGCSNASPRDTALRLGFASGGLCSATAISDDVILTAEHCFSDHDRLTTINGEPANALKIERDGQDHVLVRVTKRFKQWSPIRGNVTEGEHVRMWGNPLGLPLSYRELVVMLVQTDQILLDGGVTAPGDSGSGMFDSRGRIVGVLSGSRSWRNPSNGVEVTWTWLKPLAFTKAQYAEMA